ncbi:hypothetical protein CY34DRAFT_810053 [Suillus luteus UH-Slu-Lm8-n1]|uniref:Uncharacterized protein n=1 Tax=Suillus luteus UH-Slu-Lm8-n1 TaxID=930992 RepID=A0A0D0A7X4_9AGAM|nr:hypothetical protein CY34DRAFT_810053 [Suillus luteus UH-Slu-Lm8-n1]
MIPPVYQPLPYALSGLSFTQQVGIQISNIGSIAILWLVYMGYITEGKHRHHIQHSPAHLNLPSAQFRIMRQPFVGTCLNLVTVN